MPPPRGEGRVALVTGAASGIGASIAERLAGRGWVVAGVDLRRSATALSLEADVTDREAVSEAVARARELGRVEALVTAAGIYEMVPVGEISPERWRSMLRVHLGGVANACWAALGPMLEAGSGAIVTVSSELALAGGGRGDAHYAAAKGAILGFTRSLGAEVAGRGVRVNSVAPGPTDTPLLAPDSPWRAREYLDTLPLGRLVRPEEVADTVVFLVEEAGYFAGQVISPNAGAVI